MTDETYILSMLALKIPGLFRHGFLDGSGKQYRKNRNLDEICSGIWVEYCVVVVRAVVATLFHRQAPDIVSHLRDDHNNNQPVSHLGIALAEPASEQVHFFKSNVCLSFGRPVKTTSPKNVDERKQRNIGRLVVQGSQTTSKDIHTQQKHLAV